MTIKSIIKAKNMLTLPRLAIYLIAWFLLVFVTAFISAEGLFIKIDEYFYTSTYSNATESSFDDKIILVDIPRENLSLEQYRSDTANLLRAIDSMATDQRNNRNVSSTAAQNQRSPTVILDLNYGASTDGVIELRSAINQLKQNGINVYGAYTMPSSTEDILFDTYDSNKNKILYDSVFVGGRLHPNYNINSTGCIVTYHSFLDIPRDTIGNSIRIESLITRVTKDYLGYDEVNFYEQLTEEVPIDSINERFNPRTYYFTHTLNSISNNFPRFTKNIDLSGKLIIVGRFKVDKKILCQQSIPGPFLLASGLTNKLQPISGDNTGTKKAHADIPVQLTMAFLFALLTCLFFAFLYKYVKSLQTKPLYIAILAFIGGILILLALGYGLLRIDYVIRPALPGVSMFWAAFLAWRFANKFLVTGIVEGSGKYDVFISYSFGDSAWVKQNLYAPLQELKKSDGSKLQIFFAENSIEIGELFVSKYMKAIVNSKLFIPVMSKEYYRKNHCKNEMDLAVKRKIEELLNICILAFDYNYVPDEFTNMLLIDVNAQKEFINEIHNTILSNDNNQGINTIPDSEPINDNQNNNDNSQGINTIPDSEPINNNENNKEANEEIESQEDTSQNQLIKKGKKTKKSKAKKKDQKKKISDSEKKKNKSSKKLRLKKKKKEKNNKDKKKSKKTNKLEFKKEKKSKRKSSGKEQISVKEIELDKTIKKLQKLMKEIKKQRKK